MNKHIIAFFIILAVFIPQVVLTNNQIPTGNFALPSSRQPSPLFSFGQNVVDKNEFLLVETFDHFKGQHQQAFVLLNALLYGITNRLSLYFVVPTIPHQHQLKFHSHGIGDVTAQLEGAVYLKESPDSIDSITLVGNIQMPSGSVFKKPITGNGADTFFLGATASHTSPKWYLFTSEGFTVPMRYDKNTKVGGQFLYEFGLGLNLANPGGESIVLALLELNGAKTFHSTKNIITLAQQGNAIFFGPSLFLSTRRLILQAGIQFPILQQLRHDHTKSTLRASIQLTWHFGGNADD
jgi:hypothetical protein